MSTETETMEAKAQGKGLKAAKAVGAGVLALCLVGSLGLNVYQAQAQRSYASQMGAFIAEQKDRWAKEEEQENTYQEDGFKVAGEYEIRSTTHISDAYKSGDDSQLSAEDKDTLKMAEDVLDEVLSDGMDNYEKELAVYRWMVANIGNNGSNGVIIRPGSGGSPFTPHDVLKSKNAVCVGYATTFRLFMNMLGMDCHIVHNDYHSWDLVELEPDQWYHVDVYSDAHGAEFANFNMTDAICDMGHSWDGSALPVADSVKYSPAVRNSVEVDSLLDVPAQFKKALDEKQGAVYYRFKTPLTEEDQPKADFLAALLENAMRATIEDSYFRAMWYPGEDGNDILGLLVERYDEDEPEPSFDPASPEAKAVIRAIAEAFGLDPAELGDTGDDPEEPPVAEPLPGTKNGGSVIID